MAQTTPGGTILRGEDGSWFYIRDDKLDQFKVTDKETLDVFQKLGEAADAPSGDDDVSGFAMKGGGFAIVDGGPVTFQRPQLLQIGFGNLALRANRGLGIGSC